MLKQVTADIRYLYDISTQIQVRIYGHDIESFLTLQLKQPEQLQ